MADFEYALIGEMRKIRRLKPTEDANFSINTMDTLINVYNNVMGLVVLIGLIITGISLFVGGIGVMNIMLVSVTERTREIGIRKSIGAKRRNILSQFLMEATILSNIGGLIGVLVGFGLGNLLSAFTSFKLSIPMDWALIGLIFCTMVGLIFGYWPAHKASQLKPIESLRYE